MWVNDKLPEKGAQIRVNRGIYYHHGIYESDDVVYQFAAPKGSEINPENAIILTTNLEDFLKGGLLEVRIYSDDELNNKRTSEEIINEAKSHLGSKFGGYSIISNNCEHFSNYCVFGEKKSEQVDFMASILGGFFK